MNLKTHIDAVKELWHGGPVTDDTRYSDGFFAHMLFAVRNDLLRKRLDKGVQLSETTYNTICMDMIDASFSECNCDTNDCIVKRSMFKIPELLNSKKGASISVMNLNGEVIDSLSIDVNKYASKYSLTSPVKEQSAFDISSMSWYLHNNYIFIQNNPHIAKILIKGVFSESVSTQSFELCSGTNTNCVYPYSDSGFIDADLLPVLYTMTIQMLSRRFQDKLNDAVDTTVPLSDATSPSRSRKS